MKMSTSIKQLFASPLKDAQCNIKSSTPLTSTVPLPHVNNSCSKLIISNMESVISAVKKKRKAKKLKRRTEEPEISDISNILSSSLCFASPNSKETTVENQLDSGKVSRIT